MKLSEIKSIMSTTFQRVATVEISQLIEDAILGDRYLRPYILKGFAGLGKTHLVEKMREILEKFGYDYKEIPVGCTASQFWTILRDAKEYTFFFGDECHELGCKNQLKAVTETGGKAKTLYPTIGKETIELVIDPSKWIFVLASNESLKDSALAGSTGRFHALTLEPYEDDARKSLIKTMAKAYSVNLPHSQECLDLLSGNVRPFARAIKNLVLDINVHSRDKEKTIKGIQDLKAALLDRDYYKGGFKKVHIDVMKFLGKDANGRQVKEIAQSALNGLDIKDVQSILDELMQANFLKTTTTGKKILTQQGVDYLTSLATPKAKAATATK